MERRLPRSAMQRPRGPIVVDTKALQRPVCDRTNCQCLWNRRASPYYYSLASWAQIGGGGVGPGA